MTSRVVSKRIEAKNLGESKPLSHSQDRHAGCLFVKLLLFYGGVNLLIQFPFKIYLPAYNIATGNNPPPPTEDPAAGGDERIVRRKRRREKRPRTDRNDEINDDNDGPMSHQDYIDKRRCI